MFAIFIYAGPCRSSYCVILPSLPEEGKETKGGGTRARNGRAVRETKEEKEKEKPPPWHRGDSSQAVSIVERKSKTQPIPSGYGIITTPSVRRHSRIKRK